MSPAGSETTSAGRARYDGHTPWREEASSPMRGLVAGMGNCFALRTSTTHADLKRGTHQIYRDLPRTAPDQDLGLGHTARRARAARGRKIEGYRAVARAERRVRGVRLP